MANTILSPYMSLPVPVVGVDPGPQFASDVNSCLTLLDSHNHSPGFGVQINPAGININADLAFNNNNLTSARSIRMQSQGAVLNLVSDLDCIYVVAADLYYNDGNGNNVRITQGGGVAGSPGSISNLTSPASASYVSANQTFVWESAALTPANMDCGSIIIREVVANAKGITLSSPTGLVADYVLTFPGSLPGSSQLLAVTSSGQISFGAPNNSIPKAALTPLGQQTSASCGLFSDTSGNLVSVTNLSVTITTTGRPVYVGLISTPGQNGPLQYPLIGVQSGSPVQAYFFIVRDGTPVSTSELFCPSGVTVPPSSVSTIDTPSASTHTYTIQVQGASPGVAVILNHCQLLAYEL